jgi:hypothetical protein
LRHWDYSAAQKPDRLLVNSHFIRNKVQRYYGRDAEVVYPPVDLALFKPEAVTERTYFLAIGRFLHYKKFDLVIQAFNELKLPLKIVGDGSEEPKLRRLAKSPFIEFIPFTESAGKLRLLYAGARALIFPQVEDFGLVAAESVACGTPVIAYDAGGAREIVNDRSGLLFSAQNPQAIIAAVKEFLKQEHLFQPEEVSKTAERFSKDRFIREIQHHAETTAALKSARVVARFA